MDETSGVALELKTGVPTYEVEDEEGRTYLLIHLPIQEGRNIDGVSGGRILPALIYVSGPITNMGFVRPLPDRSRINLDMLRSSRLAGGPF
jgi:hypothetical protein